MLSILYAFSKYCNTVGWNVVAISEAVVVVLDVPTLPFLVTFEVSVIVDSHSNDGSDDTPRHWCIKRL